MKKNIVIITVIVFLGLIIYRYGFLLIFWFTIPKNGELTSPEKTLFERIRIENQAKEVWREPKYNISGPKDTTVYKVIINKIPCTTDTLFFKKKAADIKRRLDSIQLHKNYYKYQIFYECIDGKEYIYTFKR